MPVNMNPPPIPTPQNTNATLTPSATPTPSATDNPTVDGDAFARLLQTAGNRLVDANHALKPVGNHAGGDPLRQSLIDAAGRQTLSAAKAPATATPLLLAAAAPAALDTIAGAQSGKTAKENELTDETAFFLSGSLAAITAALIGGVRLEGRSGADSAAPATADGTAPASVARARTGPDLPAMADDASAPATRAASAVTTTALSLSADAVLRTSEPKDAVLKPASSTDRLGDAAPLVALNASPLTSASPASTVISVDTPVNSPGWQQELAGKLAQMVVMRSDRAEIHLHPAELGPVNVQISFLADQAMVLITAPQATTRDSLEQALPHLRDMLAEQGITLGQATVQSEHRDPPSQPRHGAVDARGDAIDPIPLPEVATRVLRLNGLVDVFA